MKKTKTLALLASILMLVATLTSCEKFALEESGTNTHDANANVIIRVDKIGNIDFEPLTKASEKNISDVCSRLSFAVFDGEEKVAIDNQVSTDNGFGRAGFKLDEGEYRLVVVGHNGAGNCTISAPEKIKFSNNKLTDTFYYCGRLSVSEDGAETDIPLKRAVSRICVHINDEKLPTDAHSIKFYYTGGSSTLDATTGTGCVNSRQTESFKLSEDVRDYTVYTFPHADSNTISMTITILDPDGKTLNTFKNESMKVACNHTTQANITLNGKSSGGSSSGGIHITFDDDWGEDIEGGSFE